MLECLECKTELEFDITVDTWADEEIVEMKNIGHCPKCEKKYKWIDIYRYTESQDLKERD
jgi:hypothetical protein